MRKILTTFIIFMMLTIPFSSIGAEEGLAVSSSSAILLEASTGEIIFEKNNGNITVYCKNRCCFYFYNKI